MRSVAILVVVIIIAVLSAPAMAVELLEGVVVSMNPPGKRFVLLVGNELNPVTVTYRGGDLPAGVAPGSRLRVRGAFTKPGLFRAESITTIAAPDSRKDPTGVRSRLLQRKKPF